MTCFMDFMSSNQTTLQSHQHPNSRAHNQHIKIWTSILWVCFHTSYYIALRKMKDVEHLQIALCWCLSIDIGIQELLQSRVWNCVQSGLSRLFLMVLGVGPKEIMHKREVKMRMIILFIPHMTCTNMKLFSYMTYYRVLDLMRWWCLLKKSQKMLWFHKARLHTQATD